MMEHAGRTARIAVLPGDGIGPEVIAGARRVLETVARHFGHAFEFVQARVGGEAIDADGTPLPAASLAVCRAADAVLLGAVGGPQWDDPDAPIRPEQGLLALRKAMGCFANLRPVRPHPALARLSPLREERVADVDFIVVRELTGGIYFGDHRIEHTADGLRAVDVCAYTVDEIARITRVAGRAARDRRGRVTSVDKANVLETSRLWRRVTTAVMRNEFPDVELTHMLVDTCAMELIRQPSAFDVVLTENMFGDILTDEAAVLAGSIGVLPSASIGHSGNGAQHWPGIYEPIHGSAPGIAGRQIANPVGAILSAALLLRHSLTLTRESAAIEAAVDATLASGYGTPDLEPQHAHSTIQLADEIARRIVA